jgi:hypothetical protein
VVPPDESSTTQALARALRATIPELKLKCGSNYLAVRVEQARSPLWHLLVVQCGDGARKSVRLLSPRVDNPEGVAKCAAVLRSIEENGTQHSVRMNPLTGLRIHVSAHGMSCSALTHMCMNFVKYEEALDTLVPMSRRTGSDASNRFFQSNKAAVAPGQSNKRKSEVISACTTEERLVELFNPSNGCYKLNLRSLLSNGRPDAQDGAALEFRQHSATGNVRKIQAWIAVCLAFVENSSGLRAPATLKASRTLDEQFAALFQYVVRNDDLLTYYQDRRRLLAAPAKKRKSDPNARQPKKSNQKKAECGCCFSVVSFDAMCACQDKGHRFCRSCVRRYAKEQLFTSQRTTLKCMSIDGCPSDLNTRHLEMALPDDLSRKFREARYFRDEERNGKCVW